MHQINIDVSRNLKGIDKPILKRIKREFTQCEQNNFDFRKKIIFTIKSIYDE